MGHVKDRWKNKDGTPTSRYGKGVRYQVWYTVDKKPVCGGSFMKKSDADNHLTTLEADLLRGKYVDPNNTTTVSQWMREFAELLPTRPRAKQNYKDAIRLYVDGTALGETRLNKLSPRVAQAWATGLSDQLAPSYTHSTVSRVKRALKAARAEHLLVDDPFADVILRPVEAERIIPLTTKQVAAIADVIGLRYRAMVLAQAGLGLRIGELLGLRVQDVDFLRRVVHVRVQVDAVTQELVGPKTKRSTRDIPLPATTAAELSAHMQRVPPVKGGPYNGLIFHTNVGTPYLRQNYRTRVFKGAVRKAHLDDPTLPLETSAHALRHYYASLLLAAGESVIAVAERLGHQNAVLVMKVYGHLMPDREDHTRRAVDAAFAPEDAEIATAPPRPQTA